MLKLALWDSAKPCLNWFDVERPIDLRPRRYMACTSSTCRLTRPKLRRSISTRSRMSCSVRLPIGRKRFDRPGVAGSGGAQPSCCMVSEQSQSRLGDVSLYSNSSDQNSLQSVFLEGCVVTATCRRAIGEELETSFASLLAGRY